MTDKEKNAIKDCDSIFICLDDAMSEDSANDYRKSYKILKNLIEKQSKEIEELKDRNKELNKALEEWINGERIPFNCISKDKIKAKIEEIKQRREKDGECELALHGFQREAKIEVLQSLLEKEKIYEIKR